MALSLLATKLFIVRTTLAGVPITIELGGIDRVVGDEAVAGDDRVLADHRAFHDRGADADQAVVADAAAVQHHAMRDRAVVADHGRLAVADVHHHVVLQVGEAADAHVTALGADDRVGPQARVLADLDFPVHACSRVDVGRVRKALC